MPLKNQYEIIKELQGESQAGKDKVARIEEILSTEVKNDTTNECDTNLTALQRYCDVLSQNNAPAEQISEVQSVMSAVDATRRAEVFTTLETVLNEYAQELSSIQDTTTTTEGEDGEEGTTETQEGRAPDTELQSAVNDSLSNVQSSLVEQQGKMLAEGTTVMSALRYEYSQQLISSAQAGNDAACDTAVASLIHLTNISSSIVADKEGELALLNDTVVPRAEQAYRNGLRAGVSTDYVQAAASNSSSALLNNLISTNASTVNTYRNELESYITAVVLRLSNSDGTDYLNQRLEDAQNFYDDVPNDDFSESVRETVDSHIEFLTNKIRELELAAGGNELDQLIAEKESLQTDYMAALDNNDLTGAKAIEEQISALDDQIAQQQAQQADELNAAQSKLSDLEDQLANAQAGSSEAADLEKQIAAQKAEISALESSMSDGSLGELVATLKAECLSIIGDSSSGDPERNTLKNDIDTLVSLLDQNVKLVFPALQEIHEAMTTERDLNGDSSYGDEITTVEDAILGSKALYDAALSGSLSADQLQEIADAFLTGEGGLLDAGETDLSSLSDWEKNCVYLLALQRYYDATQGSAALQLLGSVSQQQVNLGSPLVFVQAQDPSMEYLPVKTAAQAAGLRYVWNQNKSQGTLAKGSLYYTFAAYSDLVQKGKDEESYERMTKAARLENGTLYLPEDYTLSAFSVEAQYLSATSYGVVVREDLSLLADELCSRFLAA